MDKNLIIVGLLIALAVVLFFEWKYLIARKRALKEDAPTLEDKSHNALLTSRAILRVVASQGADVSEAREVLNEADMAYRRGNHMVCIELTEKAKRLLKAAKARSDQIKKLEPQKTVSTTAPPVEEKLTKEIIKERFPEKFLESKFSISVARERIDSLRRDGRDVSEAESHLSKAQSSFDKGDFPAALSHALAARHALESAPVVEAPPKETVPERACPECGKSIKPDDRFCRGCGMKIELKIVCNSCGKEAKPDDSFCRGCGQPLEK